MKKQTDNRYQGTRFNAVPKHKNTFLFSKGNDAPEVSDRMPAYHGSGRQEYKRILPPMRDHKDIDLRILEEVMTAVVPGFDMSKLKLSHGLCEAGKLKFRFSDLRTLLKTLQSEGYLNCDDYIKKSIEYRYNCFFQNKKHG